MWYIYIYIYNFLTYWIRNIICTASQQPLLLWIFLFLPHLWTLISSMKMRAPGNVVEPRLLAECHKRRLNQGSFWFAVCCVVWFFALHLVCVFSCIVLFVSISHVIGSKDRLWNDLDYVRWGVKTLLRSNNHEDVLHCTLVCNTSTASWRIKILQRQSL